MIAALFAGAATARAQDTATPVPSNLDTTLEAGEAGGEAPSRRLTSWNEFDGKYLTLRVGGGFLYEFDAYAQDQDSKSQITMYPDDKLRDMRVLLKGQLKFIKSPTFLPVTLK